MTLPRLLSVVAALLLPLAARAAGAHGAVGCGGCHQRAGFPVNKTYLNPRTNQPYSGTTAVCLACHQTKKNGGTDHAPIERHLSHPFGLAAVDARKARVPAEWLYAEGRFECTGCHDPHPSNANYKYLRADVGPKGQDMDRFCAVCHPAKAG
jgi:predicted CXXCH cytochrome family protein